MLNAIKMIHTIARYYNTTERMTNLLTKITNQMILNCKACILGDNAPEQLWEQEPTELVVDFFCGFWNPGPQFWKNGVVSVGGGFGCGKRCRCWWL